MARRSRILPDGGEPDGDLLGLQERLLAAAQHARTVGRMYRTEDGRAVWRKIYETLSAGRSGLLGAVTSRAEAQTLRLSMLYALLDHSVSIGAEHIRAAAALWSYADASVRYVFGDALGDPLADEILRALRSARDGLTRTQISGALGRNRSSCEIDRALTVLAELAQARSETERTGGRPTIRWRALIEKRG